LPEWVGASKDEVVKVLENFGSKGNVGCLFEYNTGEGVFNSKKVKISYKLLYL
jgi:hypothetical protein